METHYLEFVATMTTCPSKIRKICHNIRLASLPINPLKCVLITPLFASIQSLDLVREMADAGSCVMFDSGGYYVQTGRLSYDELFYPLLAAYETHRWASLYVLPDYVPTSRDHPEVVTEKVRQTIRTSKLFFEELPDELKPRAMPVVHGRTVRQVDECLEAYFTLGVRQIGFGSFGTIGSKNEVNVATRGAVDLARYVIRIAHQHGVRVHLFGLGVPAITAMLKGIQADSFDSSSWRKAAGFGQVFLPFMRAYNITYKTDVSELQRGITDENFRQLKALTGHDCALCRDISRLREDEIYRATHNLIVLAESVEIVNGKDFERIRMIYKNGSTKYQQEADKWLAG